MARPRKLKFPIVFNEWLRAALNKKRPEDRMKIFREWRRGQLLGKLGRKPTEQELFDDIKIWQEKEFNGGNFDYVLMDNLRYFAPFYYREARSEKARRNANKRWLKKS